MNKRIIKCSIILLIAIHLLLILSVCAGTVYTADDYWHAVTAGGAQDSLGGLVQAAWTFMLGKYNGWQGTYLSMFLQILLCPLNWDGVDIYLALHLVLGVTWLLFVGMIYLLMRCVLRWIGIGSEWMIAACYAVYLVTLLNTHTFAEDFLWFSGATSYMMPMILVAVGLLLYFTNWGGQEREPRKKASTVGWTLLLTVVSGILLFLACGGSLEVTLAVDYLLFVAVVYRIARGRKWLTVPCLLPICGAYIGTIINGIAPGNYTRHNTVSESRGMLSSVYHAVLTTLFQLFDESDRLFNTSVLGVGILLAMITGVVVHQYLRKDSMHRYIVVTLLALPLPFVEIFPIAFGYGEPGIPERALLLIYMTVTALCLNAGMCCGWYLADVYENGKALLATLALLTVVVMMTDHVALYRTYDEDTVQQLPVSILAMDIQKGWVSQYYDDVRAFYDAIQNADESDVVIYTEDIPEAPDGLMPVVIYEADCIAQYYGKSGLEVADAD